MVVFGLAANHRPNPLGIYGSWIARIAVFVTEVLAS